MPICHSISFNISNWSENNPLIHKLRKYIRKCLCFVKWVMILFFLNIEDWTENNWYSEVSIVGRVLILFCVLCAILIKSKAKTIFFIIRNYSKIWLFKRWSEALKFVFNCQNLRKTSIFIRKYNWNRIFRIEKHDWIRIFRNQKQSEAWYSYLNSQIHRKRLILDQNWMKSKAMTWNIIFKRKNIDFQHISMKN